MNDFTDDDPQAASRERAKRILSPFLVAFREAIMEAWNAWERLAKTDPEFRRPLMGRSRAACMYDHITANVRRKLSDIKGVRLSDERGFLVVILGADYVVRFKKLDKKGRARGIPTNQAKLWSLQLELPGLPPAAVKLIAGYQLDLLEEDVERVLVTLAVGRKVEWMFAIDEAPASNVVPMPAPAAVQPQTPAVTSTLVTKKEETQGEDE